MRQKQEKRKNLGDKIDIRQNKIKKCLKKLKRKREKNNTNKKKRKLKKQKKVISYALRPPKKQYW